MRHALTTIVLATSLIGAPACGGKKGDTTPTGGGDDAVGDQGGGGDTVDDQGGDDGMYPPEMLDEVRRALERKRRPAARCLADAIKDGRAKRNAKGHVTLTFVIGTNGKARGIKVTESTIKNPSIEECVVAEVAAIDFPHPPRDLDWSYSYGFDSM